MIKQIKDQAVALTALLFIASLVVMPSIALPIKIDSPTVEITRLGVSEGSSIVVVH